MNADLTTHAVRRYQERVKPGLSLGDAYYDLQRMIALCGELRAGPPEWVHPEAEEAAAWLHITEDISLPLVTSGDRYLALTTMTRGSHGPAARAHLTRVKRAKRNAHRAKSGDMGRKQRGRADKGNRAPSRRWVA